jgi:hypothetical protein
MEDLWTLEEFPSSLGLGLVLLIAYRLANKEWRYRRGSDPTGLVLLRTLASGALCLVLGMILLVVWGFQSL